MPTIRPLSDWIVVRCEKEVPPSSLIIVPHGSKVLTAEVLAVGPGRFYKNIKHRVPPDVSVGERVVFYKANLETQQGKQVGAILQEMGDDLGLIRSTDILLAIEAGAQVNVQ